MTSRSIVLLVALVSFTARAADVARPQLARSTSSWVTLGVEPALRGFQRPLFIGHAGDGSQRLFVVEQGGLVRVVHDGKVQAQPFLDAAALLGAVGGEQGLLGIAFHPRFKENGRLFIAYTDKKKNNAVSELRATRDRSRADLKTLRPLLAIDDFASNHNGGMLAFGPDGKLYIGTGDGGGGGDPERTAQNDASLLGKMLIVDVDTGTRSILAKGLRNPWRYSFDRETGDLWIGDVGQDRYEYIYVIERAKQKPGLNFGWSVLEGAHCFRPEDNCDAKGFEPVIFEYPHAEGCSVTGGYVYRGKKWKALRGTYVAGDFCSGQMWTVKRTASGGYVSALAGKVTILISSFGEDESGELWVSDYNEGSIHRLSL